MLLRKAASGEDHAGSMASRREMRDSGYHGASDPPSAHPVGLHLCICLYLTPPSEVSCLR